MKRKKTGGYSRSTSKLEVVQRRERRACEAEGRGRDKSLKGVSGGGLPDSCMDWMEKVESQDASMQDEARRSRFHDLYVKYW